MPVTNYDMSEITMWNMYKESYDFMMGHPMIKQMKKENKKLKKEVAHLKAMLAITQENMRLMIEYNRTKKSKLTKPLYTTASDTENVVDVINLDAVVVDEPNIKYEIIENYSDMRKNLKKTNQEVVEYENEIEKPESEDDNINNVEVSKEVEAEEEEVEEVEVEAEEEEVEEVEVEAEEEEVEEVEVEAEEEEVEAEEEEVEAEEEEAEVEVEEVEAEEEEVEAEEEEVEAEEEEVEAEEEEVEEVEVEEVKEAPTEPATEESGEEEVFEIIINGKTYYTDDREWGSIYDIDENGEINMEVGKFSNGVVKFY